MNDIKIPPSKGKILIVDDTPANLQILTQMLTEQGYQVFPAINGKLALMSVQSTLPDLILLDILMPEMDGYDVCKTLKADERTYDIPVIFISALDDVFDKVKAFSLGGVDYITKPFQREELLARVQTHLKLHRLHHELVQSEKMASLGRLVAGFAHEINTPIGVAVSAASTLQDNADAITQLLEHEEVDEDDLVSVLESIKEAANLTLSNLRRASNLVRSFKRTAIDQTQDEIRRFEVGATIFDVITMLHNQFKQTGIKIQVECPDDLSIDSVPGTLEQILTNLMMNSLIHGFEEGQKAGRILITATLTGENLHLEYSDTGKGIAPENLEKIFEPFFTTHRAHGGTGLGLYICYNLVTTQLHGNITCESSPGKGVLFVIDYPVQTRNPN
ncbi:MAG: hybrid sensor histidine kinase/response regulator [Candidatus Parabeggiatoa sp. nov. 2]|nr:MAG: hybrid sensor histidine kinase/response regulator [Gammaproteobacteria bacterium]